MSAIAFLQQLLDAGLPLEAAMTAARIHEESAPARRSRGAERQARYEERKRQKASESVRNDANDDTDANPLPLPPSPQTPQPPTPTPGDIYTPAREGPDLTGAVALLADLIERVAADEIAKEAARRLKQRTAEGFIAFWSAYPKRKSKDTAAKAFAKAMGRITDDDPLAVILAGIERAMPGWDDPQFIPYPATWLNAAGWEDDAPTVSAPRPRNDRPHQNTRADNRAVWAEVLAESAAESPGPGQPLRLAG